MGVVRGFKLFFLKLFGIEYCHKCLGTTLTQFQGSDRGRECSSCGYVNWDVTYNDFKRLLSAPPEKTTPSYKDGVDVRRVELFKKIQDAYEQCPWIFSKEPDINGSDSERLRAAESYNTFIALRNEAKHLLNERVSKKLEMTDEQKVRSGQCVSELTVDRCPKCIDTCKASRYKREDGLVGETVEVEATEEELESIGINSGTLVRPIIGVVTQDYRDGYLEVQLEINTQLESFKGKKQGHSILKSMVKWKG